MGIFDPIVPEIEKSCHLWSSKLLVNNNHVATRVLQIVCHFRFLPQQIAVTVEAVDQSSMLLVEFCPRCQRAIVCGIVVTERTLQSLNLETADRRTRTRLSCASLPANETLSCCLCHCHIYHSLPSWSCRRVPQCRSSFRCCDGNGV